MWLGVCNRRDEELSLGEQVGELLWRLVVVALENLGDECSRHRDIGEEKETGFK